MRRQWTWATALVVALGLAVAIQAQTVINFGTGTLQYTVGQSQGQCDAGYGHPPDIQPYTIWQYSNFIYTDQCGFQYSLPFGGVYIDSPGGSSCPQPGPSTTMSSNGYGFQIGWTPADAGGCGCSYASVPAGYLDPKYIIAAMVYAPPGPNSWVKYTSSAYTGNSSTIAASFTNSTTVSTSLGWGGKLLEMLDGVISAPTQSQSTTTANRRRFIFRVRRAIGTARPAIRNTRGRRSF